MKLYKLTNDIKTLLTVLLILLSIGTNNIANATSNATSNTTSNKYKQVNSDNSSLAPMLQQVIPAVVNIRSEGQLPPVIYLHNQRAELGHIPALTPSADSNQDDLAENHQSNPDFDQRPNPATPPKQPQQRPQATEPFIALGSGVIISAKRGYIVTNAHVIKDADRVIVTLKDGRHYQAKIIGTDEPSDLAVLQIPAQKLTEIELAPVHSVSVGDQAVAIGNPFGLNQTVTSGIISALERSNLQLESFENFIQFDAPINPGNSGGALVNHQGQLIGINTAILSPGVDAGNVGIGFAIPISMVGNVAKQLIQYGKVERGVVGVMVQTLTPALASSMDLEGIQGAIVTQVSPYSPAAKAGIQVGDVITKINAMPIESANQIVNTVGFIRAGTKINVLLQRAGKTLTATPTIVDAQKQKQNEQQHNPFLYGMGLQNFNQYNSSQGNISGVLVIAVAPDSNAWIADLRPGDIILNANGYAVTDIKQLSDLAAQAKNNLTLRVIRRDGSAYITITKYQTQE